MNTNHPPYHDAKSSEDWPLELVGELGAALAPVAIDAVDRAMLKSRLMSRVQRGEEGASTTTIPRSDDGWERFSARVEIKVLHRAPDATSYLLKLAPNATIWPHHHRQDEECVVLEGEIIIGDTRVKAGAYHLAPIGVDHVPIRSESGAILFLRGAMPSVRDLDAWGAVKHALK